MEEYVENVRSQGICHTDRTQGSEEDGFEMGMQVPRSVLNDCNNSFVSADEKRQKASIRYFSDTGLMSLLCRHDQVLWVVNMTSAGEKQHYALALIQRLFDHLPPNMTVGILYDIGCQLHRSCEKWGFLKDHLHRITFGISVFHAYGDQWPCQIVYHPRKCSGFGLSDGEGCERFWSSLKKLIPSLRVSGVSCVDLHHHPPILIFVSVSSAAPCSGQPNSIFWWKSLESIAHWLQRRWYYCQQKKRAANEKLTQCNISKDVLRAEWAAQISEQTKPAPRALIRSSCRGRLLTN